MIVLSDEVKTFIVQQLACFDTPSEVAKAVKEEFDTEVSRQAVSRYDPTKPSGADLSEAYSTIFVESRKRFLEDTAAIGITNRAVRLRELQKMLETAKRQGNLVLAASLLEQAAKESGGAFTNKREVGGIDGKPIQTDTTLKVEFVKPQAGPDANDPGTGGL